MIYTTNYDSNLEAAYRLYNKPFTKIANPSDLVRAAGADSQIIKFHGDFDDDQSMVIAETDYFKRLTFDTPLDMRLKSDALSRKVLFIGYSVSDLNIRLLLYRLYRLWRIWRIWRIWRESGRERDRPQSYVFATKPDPIQEAVLGQWDIRMLSEQNGLPPAESLANFLERLREEVGNSA